MVLNHIVCVRVQFTLLFGVSLLLDSIQLFYHLISLHLVYQLNLLEDHIIPLDLSYIVEFHLTAIDYKVVPEIILDEINSKLLDLLLMEGLHEMHDLINLISQIDVDSSGF